MRAVEAVVAAIKNKSNSLQALTAAALLLPGLLQSPQAAAEENEVDFQYGHYQEGYRNLYGAQSKFDPIEVDSLHGSAKITLADRIKLSLNYSEDTWSGATPITTAPLVFDANRAILKTTGRGKNAVTTVVGASPYVQSGQLFVDRNFNPINYNLFGTTKKQMYGAVNKQVVHTMSTASPETRQQGDFKLGYEWDEMALNVGGGISVERDYESRFVNLGSRWDFNQKQTSLNLGLSYTNSSTFAILDHFVTPYIEHNAFFKNYVDINPDSGKNKLSGQKEDWATQLSFSQVLNKSALIEFGAGYTRSTGYMSNPYKLVEIFFVDPKQKTVALGLPKNVLAAGAPHAFLEQRPEERNQWNLNTHYAQHIDLLDAALHFDYRFYHDDWGINSHTFELDWGQPIGNSWMVTPRVRYYTQDSADFYTPYLISQQAYNKIIYNKKGVPIKSIPYDPNQLPSYFSSDQRLSGYGALSSGITVSKKFAKGLTLEAGFEYYTHKGALKLGGGGEGSYADFNYYTVNAALKVDLSTLANIRIADHSEHAGHAGHSAHSHHGGHAPAGVMFDHMLSQADDIMIGYRYMYGFQSGNMQHGADFVDDLTVRNNGCGQKRSEYCLVRATDHTMQMHMLDIMYAPTDWLNLMLMPQFMTMDMNFRAIPRVRIRIPTLDNELAQAVNHHISHEHATGGIGDTGMYALVKLFDNGEHHLHAGIGFSAPTGNVGIKYRPIHHGAGGDDLGFVHYGMQLGSGTWDFKPSVTYTGHLDDWSWGAQLSGTKRLEKQNKSGFALGNIFQSTVWGSYNIFDWLSTSVRGVYTTQGSIRGEYNEVHDKSSSFDYPANYGGQYWDVGFGVNATVTGGSFEGNHLAFEWLQPVSDKVNGFQLERQGALSLAWGYAF